MYLGARNRVGIGLSYRSARARICKSLRRPGIDSEDSIPPAYVALRAGTTNRVVVPARHAGNRFLGSLKGIQIRAQATFLGWRHRFLVPEIIDPVFAKTSPKRSFCMTEN
jgi:hypothetical protein